MTWFKTYLYNLWIAFNQLCNTITGGYPDECFSSRCYRAHRDGKSWGLKAMPFVDSLWSRWQDKHCYRAYRGEVLNRHKPPEMRPLSEQ